MEARRSERSFLKGLFAREPELARGEQEKLEARIARAKGDVRRAMALFNEHLAGLAQQIISLQAELSRARQGSWAAARTIDTIRDRLRIAEQAYADVEQQRQTLVLDPLRRVEEAELSLQDARRRTEISSAADAAHEALDRLRLSLNQAVSVAEARNELTE
jgi:hypothetical protein